MKNIFRNVSITKEKSKDSGFVIVFIILILGYILNNQTLSHIAILVFVLVFLFPNIFYPFAIIWFGLSELLNLILPRLLFSIIYFIIVVPTGLFRKMIGKDSLKLNIFKKGKGSVLITRNIKFSLKNIQKPY